MKKSILLFIAIYFVFSFVALAEPRSGVPTKVMLVNATNVPSLWIYIPAKSSALCAADGIIKLGEDRYSSDELKMWTSMALVAFTAGKTVRANYHQGAATSGTCKITNLSIY